MCISNQSIVDQNYIENEALVSTVDFRVQSAVSWEIHIKKKSVLTVCIKEY